MLDNTSQCSTKHGVCRIVSYRIVSYLIESYRIKHTANATVFVMSNCFRYDTDIDTLTRNIETYDTIANTSLHLKNLHTKTVRSCVGSTNSSSFPFFSASYDYSRQQRRVPCTVHTLTTHNSQPSASHSIRDLGNAVKEVRGWYSKQQERRGLRSSVRTESHVGQLNPSLRRMLSLLRIP